MASSPATVTSASAVRRLTPIQWMICAIAAIGFAFDTYELLMAPLIIRPALEQLGALRFGTPEYLQWVGLLFYVPAVCGGIFGLLGGYLTDRFGRRRVLTWSILLYAFSAFASGFVTSIQWLLVLRCLVFIGVCVEFVAATAWLAELFHHYAKQRESVLGWTQAFGSIGGLMVAWMYYVIVTYGNALPEIYGAHMPWRYLTMSGVIPAIPLIVIRPFLPESPIRHQKKSAGTLKRPSIAELFAPRFRRTTIVTTIMFACTFGAAFGAIQQMPQQIVPGLEDVRTLLVSASGGEVVSTPGGPVRASLEKGDMGTGPTMGTVLTDEDCAPDAQGISHCLNELELADGTSLTVRHNHRMSEVPCLTPGEQVMVKFA